MGLTHTTVKLSNPRQPELSPIEVEALVDTAAAHLCIPEHIAAQLALDEAERREVTLADGSRRLLPYVGPIAIAFSNRRCFTGAMVLGNEVLLGAIPMEDLDLVIHPLTRQVTVNPANPNFAGSIAKGLHERCT